MQSLLSPAKAERADTPGLVWLRRDLRVADNRALATALAAHAGVYLVFVFDRGLLDPLPRRDRRVSYLHASVLALDTRLQSLAGRTAAGLICLHGDPAEAIPQLARRLGVAAVYASHDDEPVALERDTLVRTRLTAQRVGFVTVKDHVVLERSDVLTRTGQSFSVFTPYKRAWLARLQPQDLAECPSVPPAEALCDRPAALCVSPPSLAALGFEAVDLQGAALQPGEAGAQAALADFAQRLSQYADARDFPAKRGTSELSVHLRFGTLGIRQAVRLAWPAAKAGQRGAESWLSELVWRDFYAQILHHHPRVVRHAFKPAFDTIAWESGAAAERDFAAWCEGRTGYPLIDAAMRCLAQHGVMHNRLRMVTASFLVKDLGIDWRRGEAHFARRLNDFDLASNNGGWQWAASSGCDAQPWFRIFNPVTQSEKFDPDGAFIRRHVSELAAMPAPAVHAPWRASPIELASAGVRLGTNYPLPIVDHDEARRRTLARYAVVRAAEGPADKG